MTWLLITTLCMHLEGPDAQCRAEVRAAYPSLETCRRMIPPTRAIVREVSTGIHARVLFFSLQCQVAWNV